MENSEFLSRIGSVLDTNSFPPGGVVGHSLARASAGGLGRVWTVHLIPWGAPPGVIDRNNIFIDNCRALITVGTDQVTQIITMDYPHAGGVIQVAGQTVEVRVQATVPNPILVPRPVVGAYLAPASAPHRAILTEPDVDIAPSTQVQVKVPPTARGYRLMWPSQTPPTSLNMLQLRGDLSLVRPLALDQANNGAQDAVNPAHRSAYFPLHSQAAYVILNNQFATTLTVGLQWELELS
jgi:hypothetical protein